MAAFRVGAALRLGTPQVRRGLSGQGRVERPESVKPQNPPKRGWQTGPGQHLKQLPEAPVDRLPLHGRGEKKSVLPRRVEPRGLPRLKNHPRGKTSPYRGKPKGSRAAIPVR